jgi:hypothetical protein
MFVQIQIPARRILLQSSIDDLKPLRNLAGTLPSGSILKLSINNVKNPISKKQTASVIISTVKTDKTSEINAKSTGIEITNTENGVMTNPLVFPTSTDLNTVTDYTV